MSVNSADDGSTAQLVDDDDADGTTLCVCGTRDFMSGRRYDPAHRVLVVGATLAQRFDRELTGDIDRVVSGGARGADQLGEAFAAANGMPVGPDDRFEPDWDEHVKRAGIPRNAELIEEADIVVAFWNGTSTGTKNMIERARVDPDIAYTVVRIDEEPRPWDHMDFSVGGDGE